MITLKRLRLSDPEDGRATWIRDVWPRQRLDQERVQLFAQMYAEGGPDALPPVVTVKAEDGVILADGVHRVCAAWSLGWESLPEEVLNPLPGRDALTAAFLVALDRAAKSALPLTFSERKRAALRLLKACPDFSQRQIARLVGVSHTSVQRWAMGEDETDDNGGTRVPTPLSADALARAWLRRMWTLEQRKGLGDLLFGDRMPQRLAQAALDVFGDQAESKLWRYAKWWSEAVELVKRE
uniref:ParB/Sulfiredoxin domain-containing protein n=1 Tax=uncultured prokaryote TaxID=198431 RepID=H5SCM1_9ZZZZ|nr:hypothetical protein HGMM_F11C09C15 [uncultured prokaryote]